MEEIIKSEYEDVYRVTDGVTLHVKKYRRKTNTDGRYIYIVYDDAPKLKNYIKGSNYRHCRLKKASEDVRIREGFGGASDYVEALAGAVFESDVLVEIVPPNNYKYEIKTSGDAFSGSALGMMELVEDITTQIETYTEI